MQVLINELQGILEEGVKLGKSDKKVIDAFLNKEAAEAKKLSTDGKRLDGNWMGGRGIAEWSGGKIVFTDLGSKAAETVQRAIKKAAPKNWLAEARGLTGYSVRELFDLLLRAVNENNGKMITAWHDELKAKGADMHAVDLVIRTGKLPGIVKRMKEDVELTERKRAYAPAEGTDEREGWDKCLDLPPTERLKMVKKVTAQLSGGGGRGNWARGWMDAWDTFGDASWAEIKKRTGSTGRIKEEVELDEAQKETFDASLKGVKVVGNGFRLKASKGKKYTLTGKQRFVSAGRGYEYEMKGDNGDVIWLDGQGFVLKESVELDEAAKKPRYAVLTRTMEDWAKAKGDYMVVAVYTDINKAEKRLYGLKKEMSGYGFGKASLPFLKVFPPSKAVKRGDFLKKADLGSLANENIELDEGEFVVKYNFRVYQPKTWGASYRGPFGDKNQGRLVVAKNDREAIEIFAKKFRLNPAYLEAEPVNASNKKRAMELDEAIAPVSLPKLKAGLKSGKYIMVGETDAVSGMKKYYVIRDPATGGEMLYLKTKSNKWIEKFEEDIELDEAEGDAEKTIKVLADTDYRDKDSFFKMTQLLKGLAAVSDDDETAKEFLAKVSDALTKAAEDIDNDDNNDDDNDDNDDDLDEEFSDLDTVVMCEAKKAKQFEVGDIVRHTKKFLRNTGQATSSAINGRVTGFVKFGGRMIPNVEWSDGNASPILPDNIELDPKHKGKKSRPGYAEDIDLEKYSWKEDVQRVLGEASPYEQLIDNPDHKPKKVAAVIKKMLKKAGVVKIVKAEAAMPRSWDYGLYFVVEVTKKDGESVSGAITINVADNEVSGNVTMDAPYGVVAVERGRDFDTVLKRLVSGMLSKLMD